VGLTCIAKPEIVDTRYDNLKDLPGHPEFREGEHWRKWDLDAAQIVFGGGETGSEIYVVLSGTLMVCADVRLEATHHLQPGICELFDGVGFAQSCFSDDQPHCATVDPDLQ
jgi:CRP-like cAMP-binding protein